MGRTDGARDYCAEAVSYYEEALLLLSRVLPPKHRALLDAKTDLARILTESATAESLSEATYARGVALYASVIEELCARLQVVRAPELVQLTGHQITLELLDAVTSPVRLKALLPALSLSPPTLHLPAAGTKTATASTASAPAPAAAASPAEFDFPTTVSAIAQRCSELAALHTKAGRFQEAVELFRITLKVLRRQRAWIEPPALGPGQALVTPGAPEGLVGLALGGVGTAGRGDDDDVGVAAEGASASASASATGTGAARLEAAATSRTQAKARAARRARRLRTGEENTQDLRIAHVLLSLGQQSANLGVSLRGFNTQGSRVAMVDALDYSREAMELYRMIYRADDHPLVLMCLRSIAAVHAEQGKSRTARAVYDKILELYRAGAPFISHPSYTPLTPLLHPSYAPITPLLHPSYTPLTCSRVRGQIGAGKCAVVQSGCVAGR